MERAKVSTIPDFHDGFFDGLWISDQKNVHLFLRTIDKKSMTLILYGVKLLNISNVRQGNIILDFVVLQTQEISAAHIEELYGLEWRPGGRASKAVLNNCPEPRNEPP